MIALLVLFVLTTRYYRFRFGLAFNANKYLLDQIDGARAADNAGMLVALQREIANEFMRRGPEDYLHRFNSLLARWQELSNLAEKRSASASKRSQTNTQSLVNSTVWAGYRTFSTQITSICSLMTTCGSSMKTSGSLMR